MRPTSALFAFALAALPVIATAELPLSQDAANPATIAAPREDSAWRTLNEAINARSRQAAKNGDADLLFIGDSITQGWSGAGRDAWDRHFAPAGALNMGIGGDQTQHVIWRMQNGNLKGLAGPSAGKPPRVAVVMIGTNNLSAGHTPAQVAEGVKAVIAAIRSQLPDVRVLLLGVLPRSQQPDGLRRKVSETNALLERLDGGAVRYFGSGDIFLQSDGTISADLMPDFLHLSPAGYEMWAQAIKPRIDDLLEE